MALLKRKSVPVTRNLYGIFKRTCNSEMTYLFFERDLVGLQIIENRGARKI